MTPERMNAAKAYVRSCMPTAEIMDTPEKAAAEGVALGTTVMRPAVPKFIADAQLALDAEHVRNLWRAGLLDL